MTNEQFNRALAIDKEWQTLLDMWYETQFQIKLEKVEGEQLRSLNYYQELINNRINALIKELAEL